MKPIAVMGFIKTGKTSLALHLSYFYGMLYVNLESIYNPFEHSIKEWTEQVKGYLKDDVVIDTWYAHNYHHLLDLNLDLKYYLTWSPVWMGYDRYIKTAYKEPHNSKEWYYDSFNALYTDELFNKLSKTDVKYVITMDHEFKIINYDKFKEIINYYSKEYSKEDIERLYNEILSISKYHPIELPYGYRIPGSDLTDKTLNRIRDLVNFNNKKILDIGCFLGYTSHRLLEWGAKDVLGVDKVEKYIELAKKIRDVKKLNCSFLNRDIEEWTPKRYFDVILLLNVLHYTKNPLEVINRLKNYTDTLVIEYLNDENQVGKILFDEDNKAISYLKREDIERVVGNKGIILPSDRPHKEIMIIKTLG